jgi:two-component system LytT family response regulator
VNRAPPYVALPAARPGTAGTRGARWFAVLPVNALLRAEADDNGVTIVADRRYRTRGSLGALCRRLAHVPLVRVHRSHAVSAAAVRELAALPRGEYLLRLVDGSAMRSGRRYRDAVRAAFGLR